MKSVTPIVLLVALLGGIGVALWPTIGVLHDVWSNKYGAYSHGYLVLAISVWFGIRAWRASPKPVVTSPYWPSLALLAAFLGVALLADALYIGQLLTVVLPLLLLASIGLCLGGRAMSRLAWPVLFLYLAIPVWDVLKAPMQGWTTNIVQRIVTMSGVPVFVEGNFVHLPAGTIEIASGCAGLNFLVAALTFAAVYCTLFLSTWKSRITLVLAAAVASLVDNWLRVASLIVIGHVTQMQHYVIRVEHLSYGWGLFILTMLPVFLLARHLEVRDLSGVSGSTRVWTLPPWILLWSGRTIWVVVALAYATVLVLAVYLRNVDSKALLTQDAPSFHASVERANFASGWLPSFFGARESRQECVSDGTAEIYTAYYRVQSREARLSLPENSVTGRAFQVTSTRIIDGRLVAPGASLVEIRGALAGRQRLIWTWYLAAGRTAYSKRSLRTVELLGLPSGRRDAWVTAFQTECQGDCERARRRLSACLMEQAVR